MSGYDAEAKKALIHVKTILDFLKRVAINDKTGLVDAVLQTQVALSISPRDKIFALLGLCYDSGELVFSLNYENNIEDILLTLTKNWIKKCQLLDVLLCAPEKDAHRLYCTQVCMGTYGAGCPSI